MVGPKPRRSTEVNTTTAHIGSDVKYQKGREAKAAIKNTQSVRVIDISERFKNASMAINVVIVPDTPIGQAPIPPLASS